MLKKLLNPIANFPEKKLVLVSVSILILSIISGYFLYFKIDAIFHFTFSKQDWLEIFISNLRSFTIAIVVFYLLGLTFNKRTRWVDIFNTILVSQLPVLIATIVTFTSFFKNVFIEISKSPKSISNDNIFFLFLIILFWVPLLIISIVIFYNGFKTATNLKKGYHIALFILVSILVSFTQFLF